jgi:hypothetical protein
MRLIVTALVLCASCAPANELPAALSQSPDVQTFAPAPTQLPAGQSPTPRTSPTVTTSARDAVLDVADLPSGFAMTDERADSNDVFGGHGYLNGWLRFYARSVPTGIANAASQSTAWASAADAEAEIARVLKYTTETQSWAREIPLTQTIADESRAVEYYGTAAGDRTTYAIWFRAANTTNLVLISGSPGTVELAAAVDLAKKQLARLRV